MNIFKGVLVVLLLVSITGCSSNPFKAKPDTIVQADPSGASLSEAAASVSDSLSQLAKTEQAANHQINTRPVPDPKTYNMGITISVDWSGPVGPLVDKIADIAQYKVKVAGHPPAIPIIVTVSARNELLGNILSDAAYQCGNRADVVVYPATQTIELRYMGN